MVVSVLVFFKFHLDVGVNEGLVPDLLDLLVVSALVLQSAFLLDLRDALFNVLDRKKLVFSWFCTEVLNV